VLELRGKTPHIVEHQHSSISAPITRSRCVAVRGGGPSLGFTEERFFERSPSRCCSATAALSGRRAAKKDDAWAAAAAAGVWWPESLIAVDDEDAGALPRDFDRGRGGDGTLAKLFNGTAVDCGEVKDGAVDRWGSPDAGCGGGLDRSARESTSGGRLRSRCGCITTSFSGETGVGALAGSTVRSECELVKAESGGS